MKVIRIIGKSFINACKSIARNFSLSMASITCTIITLILVAIGFLISYNVENITKNFEQELEIVVFMDKKVTQEELTKTEETLKKIDNVLEVKFNSKEDIKKSMAEENETFEKIISTWKEDENPLQDSYVLRVKNVKDINETATTIKNLDKVDVVKYGESMVNELIHLFDIIKTGTIILLIGLVLVTAFLINNTIKITIFSRKKEIDIMRLVGTSNRVIKLPFLIEGFIIGVLGAIIPILLTIFGYNYIYNTLSLAGLSNILSLVQLVNPNLIIYNISLYLLIIAVIVGMFSSVKAVRKYLTI